MNITEWENWLGPEIKNNVDLVKSYVNKGDTFIDVGANTGLFTKMIVDDLGTDYFDDIVLFEPIPYLVEECKNKFGTISNIKIEELALSNEEGENTILASNQNFGYNKIYKEGMEIHSHEKFTIKCVTFSDWIKTTNIKKVDFIKIDAEGHDINVISGMFEWLKGLEKKPIILFEINWYKDLEEKLIKKMEDEFGYTSLNLGRDVLLIQ
jgi:FkbM family methyltransferase